MNATPTRTAIPTYNATGDDVKNSQAVRRAGGRPPRTQATDLCKKCGQPGAQLPKREYCSACVGTFRTEATAWQERDYLWRYVHCRGDVKPGESEYRQVARLRVEAACQGIDWRQPAPAPLTFDQRMAALTDRAPRKPPVTRAKRAKKGAAA